MQSQRHMSRYPIDRFAFSLLTPRVSLDRRANLMTTKERVLQTVKELPEDATVEDAMERLLLLAKVERGLLQADNGETISHQAVKDRMAKWL